MDEVEVSKQFIDDKMSHQLNDEKDKRSEMTSHVTSNNNRDLNKILKQLTEESVRIAAQNVERKRAKNFSAKKENTPLDNKRIGAVQMNPFMDDTENLSQSPVDLVKKTNSHSSNKTNNPHDNPHKMYNSADNPEKTKAHSNNPEVEGNCEPKQNEKEIVSSLQKQSSSSEGEEIFSLSECMSTEVNPTASPSALYYRRGSVLHKELNPEDRDLVEIREVKPNGRIKVTLGEPKSDQEARDERWTTNILDVLDSTKMEYQQFKKDNPIFQPPYSKRYTIPRKSAAETHLQIVQGVAATHSKELEHPKHASLENLEQKEHAQIPKSEDLDDSDKMNEFQIMKKLWNLYDKLQDSDLFSGPTLVLRVRENQLLEDAFLLLMTPSRIPLNHYRFVKAYITDRNSSFAGLKRRELEEDQTEEFFTLLVEGLFSFDHKSLFRNPSDDCDYFYPNHETHSHPRWFEFAGLVLALTIVHQQPVKVKFPKCFFNCFLDRPLSLEDLEEIDPLLYQKLLWIKENNVSDRRMSFSVRDSMGDESMEYGLQKGTILTEKNKFWYIERCLKWKLVENCLDELKHIRRGFVSVLDPSFLSDFTDAELQQLCLKSLQDLTSEEEIKSTTPLVKRRSL